VVNYYEESTSTWDFFINYDSAFTCRERGISRNPHSENTSFWNSLLPIARSYKPVSLSRYANCTLVLFLISPHSRLA